jgi:hypothetical protein
MGTPLLLCIKSLVASLDVGSYTDSTYRQRSLSHVACMFANMATVGPQGGKPHLHMLLDVLVQLTNLEISDELREQAARYVARHSVRFEFRHANGSRGRPHPAQMLGR